MKPSTGQEQNLVLRVIQVETNTYKLSSTTVVTMFSSNCAYSNTNLSGIVISASPLASPSESEVSSPLVYLVNHSTDYLAHHHLSVASTSSITSSSFSLASTPFSHPPTPTSIYSNMHHDAPNLDYFLCDSRAPSQERSVTDKAASHRSQSSTRSIKAIVPPGYGSMDNMPSSPPLPPLRHKERSFSVEWREMEQDIQGSKQPERARGRQGKENVESMEFL